MSEITLILADDHAVVRSGLRMLLDAQSNMLIIGEANNGREALELTHSLKANVVLMDIMMPEMNGIEATRRITTEVQGTAVHALTMYENEQYFLEMHRAGATGYVPKRVAPDVLEMTLDVYTKVPIINRRSQWFTLAGSPGNAGFTS